MVDQPSDEAIARYLAGEGTDEEGRAVEAGLARHPELAAEVERLRAALATVGQPRHGWDVEAAWRRGLGRREAARRSPGRALLLVVAAAAVALVAFGITDWWRARPAFTTAAAQVRLVDLPDGSHVVLAPLTSLRLRRGFGARYREVDLSGEAWFEVRHVPTAPFRVWVGDLTIEQVGTEFSVRARPGGAVEVLVAQGEVAVRRRSDPAFAAVALHASQVARVAPGGPIRTGVEPDVDRALAWRTGELRFDRTPIPDVLARLGEWFGRPLVLAHSVPTESRLTATLDGRSLASAIEVLCHTLPANYEVHGDTVVLLPFSAR